MAMSDDSRRAFAPIRKLIHLLVVVFGWIGFVWLWLLVAARPWESRGLVWLILGSLVIAPLVTGAWVLHNRSLYRRKGERQAVAAADTRYTRDWHGREVQADWRKLREARLVVIGIDGDRKLYRSAAAGAAEPAIAAAATAAAVEARPKAVAAHAPLR